MTTPGGLKHGAPAPTASTAGRKERIMIAADPGTDASDRILSRSEDLPRGESAGGKKRSGPARGSERSVSRALRSMNFV